MNLSQFYLYAFLVLFDVAAQGTQTICDTTIPPNTLESTPFSTSLTQMVANGQKLIGYFEYHRSIKYVSDCGTKNQEITTNKIYGL